MKDFFVFALNACRLLLCVFSVAVSAVVAAVSVPAYSGIGFSVPCTQLLEVATTADRITVVVADPKVINCAGEATFVVWALSPGNYTVSAQTGAGITLPGSEAVVTVDAAPPALRAFTLFNPSTSTHFVTVSETDRAQLLALGWQTAGSGFKAWATTGPAPPSARPVCRFFVPAKSTHFYSGSETDCAALRGIAGFVDEGIAFRALLPAGGQCSSGTVPVFRLFDTVRVNHRYTSSSGTVSAMVTSAVTTLDGARNFPSTWVNDGIAFCSPAL